MATRWGCVGLGKIAADFFTSIKDNLSDSEHSLVGAASSDESRAKEFARKLGFKTAHPSYQALAEDPEIEVVYIACLHTEHLRVTSMMLEAGKHVLCEKPLAMNSREVKQMTALAREKKLFLMEGIWSRCFPVYTHLRQELVAGSFGKVWQVDASLCFPLSTTERFIRRDLGGGVLMSLGMYPLQLVCLIYPEMPVAIHADAVYNSQGMDQGGSFILKYKNGATCSFSFHGNTVLGFNKASIIGDKGKMEIDGNFHCPTSATTPSGRIEYPLKPGNYNYPGGEGFQYEATEVRRCLQNGWTESPMCPLEHSELIMSILDEVRKQLGVTYPADEV